MNSKGRIRYNEVNIKLKNEINHAINHPTYRNLTALENHLKLDNYNLTIEVIIFLITKISSLVKNNNIYSQSANLNRIVLASINRLNILLSQPNQQPVLQKNYLPLIYNLSYLIEAGFNFRQLGSEFLQHLEIYLNDAQDYDNSASMILYGLGILAKHKKINGEINNDLIQNLLNAVNHENNVENYNHIFCYDLHITNALYGVALLTKENITVGMLNQHSINLMLNNFNNFTGNKIRHIPLIIFSLSLLVSSGKLKNPFIDQQMFIKLIENIPTEKLNKYNAEFILFGLSSLIKYLDKKVIKHIPANVIQQSAQAIISSHPYLYPVTAINLIDTLSKFPHDCISQDISTRLTKAISVPFNRLPPDVQAKLKPLKFQISHEDMLIDFTQARKNHIYKTIDDGKIGELKKLLNVNEYNIQPIPSPNKLAQECMVYKLFNKEKTHDTLEYPYQSIVTKFFKEIKAAELKNLAIKSSHVGFNLLLNACSLHQRYQLIINRQLYPVLLYLPCSELVLFTKQLITQMQVYQDHRAVISLMNALIIRYEVNPSQRDEIQQLAADLVKIALIYNDHQKNNIHITNYLSRIYFNKTDFNSVDFYKFDFNKLTLIDDYDGNSEIPLPLLKPVITQGLFNAPKMAAVNELPETAPKPPHPGPSPLDK